MFSHGALVSHQTNFKAVHEVEAISQIHFALFELNPYNLIYHFIPPGIQYFISRDDLSVQDPKENKSYLFLYLFATAYRCLSSWFPNSTSYCNPGRIGSWKTWTGSQFFMHLECAMAGPWGSLLYSFTIKKAYILHQKVQAEITYITIDARLFVKLYSGFLHFSLHFNKFRGHGGLTSRDRKCMIAFLVVFYFFVVFFLFVDFFFFVVFFFFVDIFFFVVFYLVIDEGVDFLRDWMVVVFKDLLGVAFQLQIRVVRLTEYLIDLVDLFFLEVGFSRLLVFFRLLVKIIIDLWMI